MGKSWTHKDLQVWQRALDLAEHIYRVTEAFPKSERFGLVVQMRRAAVSIVSNIAEGAARRTRPDFLQFLHVARGSLAELEAQTILATRLSITKNPEALERLICRVGQLLTGLINKLSRDGRPRPVC